MDRDLRVLGREGWPPLAARMALAWPADDLEGPRREVYADAVADLPAADVTAAVEELIREDRESAPSPGTVRERALRIGGAAAVPPPPPPPPPVTSPTAAVATAVPPRVMIPAPELPADGSMHLVAGAVLPRQVRLSSGGKRFGAYLLNALLVVVTLGIGWIIWSLVVWQRGQNPGYQCLGMYVVRVSAPGGPRVADWGTMALRNFCCFGLIGAATSNVFNLVGALFIPFREDKKALWDLMVDTIVVDDRDAVLRAAGPGATATW